MTQHKVAQVYDLGFDVINSFEAEMLRLLLFTVQRDVGGVLRDEGIPFPKVTVALNVRSVDFYTELSRHIVDAGHCAAGCCVRCTYFLS